MPLAISVVPSTGSTATSQSGPSPLPTSSPLNSMGASSFSPSPITTTPPLPPADPPAPAHRPRRPQLAHRVDGRAVATDLVAAADPAAGRHRGGLGHPD